MSESTTQTGRTDNNQFTVGAFFTGALVDNKENLTDPEALAREVVSELSKIAMAEQQSVDEVVLVDAAEAVVEAVDAAVDQEVKFVPRFDFRGLLNDEGEGDMIEAVRADDQPAVPRSIDQPDLWNDEHKAMIDWSEIEDERVERAKHKALSKRVERMINDYFEDDPTIDGALIVDDTTSGSSEEAQVIRQALQGENDYVKYPSRGPSPSTMVPETGVLWAEVMLEADDFDAGELTERQVDRLREYRADADELLHANAPEPTASASASSGAATPADD